MPLWFLEHFAPDCKTRQRIKITHSPFKVGRQANLPLTINSPDMSRNHAEFFVRGQELILHDQGSTNGTFINQQRISAPSRVEHGDIVHFANVEYRVICEDVIENDSDQTQIGITSLSSNIPKGLQFIKTLLDQGLTSAVFQPVIFAHDESLFGYEILGRGIHPNLPKGPLELFQLAESANLEVELSELFRHRGIKIAKQKLDSRFHFLVNTHPAEMKNPNRLLGSLSKIRQFFPTAKLILEIHEEAVTNQQTMKYIKDGLQQLRIQLAYDDFGAGQARLLELVGAPPFILKFDTSLIKNIHRATPVHRNMVQTMVQLCKKSGIHPLAEGVSNREIHQACRNLGFELLQGYHFPMFSG